MDKLRADIEELCRHEPSYCGGVTMEANGNGRFVELSDVLRVIAEHAPQLARVVIADPSPTCVGCLRPMDHDGGPDYSCERCGTKKTIGYEPAGKPKCHAGQDGDCYWKECPQTAEGEPGKSGRSCPLWVNSEME